MSNKGLLLSWVSFPAREYPRTTALLVLFIIMMAVILWQITVVHWQMPLFYVLGCLILFIGIIPYFVATKYEFYYDGLKVLYPFVTVEKKYSDFGCFYMDKKGVMLSTFKMPRRLDPFRGQSIRFTRNKAEKEELIKLLTEKIGKQF